MIKKKYVNRVGFSQESLQQLEMLIYSAYISEHLYVPSRLNGASTPPKQYELEVVQIL